MMEIYQIFYNLPKSKNIITTQSSLSLSTSSAEHPLSSSFWNFQLCSWRFKTISRCFQVVLKIQEFFQCDFKKKQAL
ncbi:hypothetical protein HanXRQr2_Chr14g0623771 [Helianthus annuus]|uniref:Uncharacterized protein n=1 Tax=Helianthus annuus TaxID=4232 RepID=A0A251SET0_HELAN|nr:hypothetical protein HanXRQr2_Chr14g0623771 [Helianthus annuus]KAJ0838759.1 hypothetical protein HanPSC8_Chr14g0598611 [Helianthus annuus]